MGQIDTYNLQNVSAAYGGAIPTGATINWVKSWVTASVTWGAEAQFRTVLRTHSVNYFGAWQAPLPQVWVATSTTYVNNPFTGNPWTISELNDLQCGGDLEGYKALNPTYMTAARVEVNWDPPPTLGRINRYNWESTGPIYGY